MKPQLKYWIIIVEYKPNNQLSQFAPPSLTYGCGKLRKLATGLVILVASVVM